MRLLFWNHSYIYAGIKSIDRFYDTEFRRIGIEPVALADIQEYLSENGMQCKKDELMKLSLHEIATILKCK